MASKESKLGGPGCKGPGPEKWEEFHGKSGPWLPGFGPKTAQPRRKLGKEIDFCVFCPCAGEISKNKLAFSLSYFRVTVVSPGIATRVFIYVPLKKNYH